MLVEGGAERIFRQMELNAAHRRRIENRESWAETWQRAASPVLGFVVMMTALVGGFWLVLAGFPGSGVASVVSALGVIGTAYFGQVALRARSARKRNPDPYEMPLGE